MKSIQTILIAIMLIAGTLGAQAQFGNLGRSISNRVKNEAYNQANKEIYKATNPNNIADEVSSAIPEKGDAKSKLEVKVGNHTYKLDGKINHGKWSKHQSSTVTFTNFPATLEEFKQVQKVLGTEPQGAVALQVMAFEMYHRDPELGKAALELNNTSTNLSSTMRQLSQVMGEDASYCRPYLAAAMLKGAKPTNAYSPDRPYQIKIRVNPVTKYQESELLDGVVIYLQIDSEGWDTNWRGVEVVRPYGEDYYVVSNCPAMYTQCKKIKGKFAGLE